MNTLSCRLPAPCKEAWKPFCGTWYFSIYDDYRLTLRETRSGISVRLKDLDWDWGDEELTLIRVSEEQLVLSLYSFRLCARLRLYPDAARQGLIVEFTDTDSFTRCAPQEVEEPHLSFFRPTQAAPPEWALGTWSTGPCSTEFLRLHQEEEGLYSLAVWTDWGVKPPSKSKRSWRRILDFIWVTPRYIDFVWQGADDLNRRVEATLHYDFPRQQLQLEYTRRERASRQRKGGD